MDAIRAFIAIELPDETHRQLAQVMRQMQERCRAAGGEPAYRAVRWVSIENMHLTLKFLGETSDSNLQALASMLKAEARRHAPFTFTVGQLGAFPNPRRPRVLWVGATVPKEMAALQHAIEAETHALGYPREERAFAPHLTLGRVSHSATPREVAAVAQALDQMQAGELGSVPVERVHIFRSDLRPSGSVYTSLYAFPLGANSEKTQPTQTNG